MPRIQNHKAGLFAAFLFCFLGCKEKSIDIGFDYGATNDTALFYYHQGWQQIMDNGEWTKAEASFRKASETDPNFILGKCLQGRISRDVQERENLLQEIRIMEKSATQDQKLLIDIYKSSLQLMNKREKGVQISDSLLANHYELSEKNMKRFVNKYPKENYVKAEYIEILHAKYGSELALDSLELLTTSSQKDLPFYLGYAATMQAEINNFTEASHLLKKLNRTLNDSLKPSFYVSRAQVFVEMDSLRLAKENIDRAVALDSNHIIAKSLQKKLNLMGS